MNCRHCQDQIKAIESENEGLHKQCTIYESEIEKLKESEKFFAERCGDLELLALSRA